MEKLLGLEAHDFTLVAYWLMSGVVSVVLFDWLNGATATGDEGEHGKTHFIRRLFYFVFGGAILPLVVLVGAPLWVAGRFGPDLSSRLNAYLTKRNKPRDSSEVSG